MVRSLVLIVALLFHVLITFAQDTLVLNGQPTWKRGLPVLEYCFYYKESGDEVLSFDDIKKQTFIPYNDTLRQERSSNKPLLIRWLRLSIRNSNSSDTIKLRLNIGPHYFARLYDATQLIAKSGIYETTVTAFDKIGFDITILSNETKTFWIRTEERQNEMTPYVISLETPYTFFKNNSDGSTRDQLLFLVLSMLTGCLFFITIFAGYQYFLYRDYAFLWYIGYTFSSALVGLFWIDIRHQFGLFSSFFHDLIFAIFLFIVPVLYSLFIGNMLLLPQHFKKTWRIVQLLLVIACVQMLVEFITIRTGKFIFNSYYGYFVSMIPVAILNVIMLILAGLSREKIKWFMFSGLLSMFVLWCSPMIIFPRIEITWDSIGVLLVFVPFYFLLGLTVEAICFSFALSYRGKLLQIEKNDIQERYGAELEHALTTRTAELNEQSRASEEQNVKHLQTSFEKKIAETEMSALRAQMNPHFIFNCLNSIKLYTLQNESQTASDYLTMFSQLIRLVLENSRSEKITLKKELDTVRLYIELEAMRFKHKVRYAINVTPDIDQQYTELPPLLIQPYVENAIWHGLMHKKDGGAILIEVSQPVEDNLLVCITDDGVGREQAALYKSKSATLRKSFGLQLTSERVRMINQVYGIQAAVRVDDLKDTMNNACGTKVSINIPIC